MTTNQKNARETILSAQTEREYKHALEHIALSKKRGKGEVYLKLPESVGDRVRKKLEDDRYKVVSITNGLTHILWVDVEGATRPVEIRARAAAKLTQEEREAIGLNEDGTYRFAIAKHRVVMINYDAWSGPRHVGEEFFDTEDEAMHFVEAYNANHNPHMGKRGVPTPESYTKPEYRGLATISQQAQHGI
ncbi:hypothetical protein D3C87_1158130 [compost metagenome]